MKTEETLHGEIRLFFHVKKTHWLPPTTNCVSC